MSRLEILIVLVALALLVFVFEVVRRRRLSEGYALLWIALGLGVVAVGLGRPVIDRFSDTVGIAYGASVIFAAGFVFLLVVCINLSMHVSRLEDQVQTLAEELTLVEGPYQGSPRAGEQRPAEGPEAAGGSAGA